MGRTYNFVPATSLDYRRLAEKRLPRFLFDYIDGGANDELTLRRNVEDFQSIRVRQHVMRDVSDIDTSTTLLGEAVAMPVVLAPIGMAGLYCRRGELQAIARVRRGGHTVHALHAGHLLAGGAPRASEEAILVPAIHDP